MPKANWFLPWQVGIAAGRRQHDEHRRRPARRTRPLIVEHLESRTLLAAVPAGLVSWYRAEGDALDFSGSNDGTLQNGATFAAGKVGQAFSFDGVDDFVEVPDAANLDFAAGAPFSIELWAFRTSTASIQHLLGKRIGISPNDYNYQLPFDNAELPLNTWTHVAHAFDGAMYRVYFDGLLFSETVVGNRIGPENDATLRIGTSGTAQPFGGLIDEVAIYNRALTQSEIQSIVQAGDKGKVTIVVDTTADVVDAADGRTSLREAILESNASAGNRDAIGFGISGHLLLTW